MSKDELNIVAALRQLVKAHYVTPQPQGGPRGISLAHWRVAEDALKEYDSKANLPVPIASLNHGDFGRLDADTLPHFPNGCFRLCQFVESEKPRRLPGDVDAKIVMVTGEIFYISDDSRVFHVTEESELAEIYKVFALRLAGQGL